MDIINYSLIWLAAISGFAIGLTVCDKKSAISKNRRVSENALMLTGLIGGAAAMYITMLIIRHKTKHKRFMYGLPTMIFIHGVLAVLYILCYDPF